jgi:TniQ
MCRLATAHFLSFGSLYEFILVPNLNKTYLTTPSHLSPASTLVGSFRNRSKGINGIGKIAREWLELIETLTLRRDLRFLTLTTLSNVLCHWKLLRTFQAWCPECYEEMYQTKQIIYRPLIWTIAAVDICARHRRRLVDQCPHCHRQLLMLTRREEFGYCSRCGYWMGKQSDNQAIEGNRLSEVELDWQLFVASDVGELLSTLPDINEGGA